MFMVRGCGVYYTVAWCKDQVGAFLLGNHEHTPRPCWDTGTGFKGSLMRTEIFMQGHNYQLPWIKVKGNVLFFGDMSIDPAKQENIPYDLMFSLYQASN